MLSVTVWNVQSAVTCESGQIPSLKSDYFCMSKSILYFSYCFPVPCTVLFNVYFHVACIALSTVYCHAVISMFHFLCYWSQSKSNAVNQTIQLGFHSVKLQTVTAKNKEQLPWVKQCTLNFEIVAFFLLGLFWRKRS